MATRLIFGPAPPAPPPPSTNGSAAIGYAVSRYMNRSLDDGVTVAESATEVAVALSEQQFATFTVEHHDGTSHAIQINRDHVRMVRPGNATSWSPEQEPAEAVGE